MPNENKVLAATYKAAFILMALETAFVAVTVLQAPVEPGQLQIAGLAPMELIRAVFVPAMFELFAFGLASEAVRWTGRTRLALWGGLLALLAATGIMQIGAMSAHEVDPAVMERMGAGLYWGVRYTLGLVGPMVVGAVASIRIALAPKVAQVNAALIKVTESLTDALAAQKKQADKIDELQAANLRLQQGLAAATQEIGQMRAEQERQAAAAAEAAATLRLAPAVREGGHVSAGRGGKIDRQRLAAELEAQPGVTATQLAQLFGVSATAVKATPEWRAHREAAS